MNISNIKTSDKGIRWASSKAEIPAETNDCVVRALAVSTGTTYQEAHTYASIKLARKFRSGVSTHKLIANLYTSSLVLGKHFLPIGKVNKTVSKVEGREVRVVTPKTTYSVNGKPVDRAMTVYTFLKKYTKGSYFLLVRGHAMAVVDGVLVGNSTDHEFIRKRLVQAFAVSI